MRTRRLGFSKVAQARDDKSSLSFTSFLRSLHAKTSERSFKVLEKGTEVMWWKKEGREVS
jgi:hypothetical protein